MKFKVQASGLKWLTQIMNETACFEIKLLRTPISIKNPLSDTFIFDFDAITKIAAIL